MIGRVVEITSGDCSLSRERGLMKVSRTGEQDVRIPLDDVSILLCNARGLVYSNGLITELAKRGTAIVFCDSSFMPAAWVWPLVGHHEQTLRMRSQLEASKPLKKRLWQSIVKSKITQQANTLRLVDKADDGLTNLARRVRSGDPDNVEAQASRTYWPRLFGPSFRRHRFGETPNPLLNYGYTVVRAATARSIVSAGLHPSVGVHHTNRGNPMCLVDDLMEPFRPIVDLVAYRLHHSGINDMTADAKQELAGVLTIDMLTARGTTPLQTCIDRAAQSLAKSFQTRSVSITLPLGRTSDHGLL